MFYFQSTFNLKIIIVLSKFFEAFVKNVSIFLDEIFTGWFYDKYIFILFNLKG